MNLPVVVNYGQGGAVLVLIMFVIAILTGRLRPNRAVQEIREDRDARLEEAHDLALLWKEAYELSDAARERQEQLLREILELGRTSLAVLEALHTAAGNGIGTRS